MKVSYKAPRPLFFCACLVALLLSSCASKTRTEIITFASDNSSLSDSIKTVKNFKKQKELYVLTEFGSYDDKMDWLNNYLLSEVTKDSIAPSKVKSKKTMC